MRPVVLLILLLIPVVTSTLIADGAYFPRVVQGSYARDITEPEQKAIINHFDGKETLTIQVSYKGSASDFAWLVPTPSKPSVKLGSDYMFEYLHDATAITYRYWFDADKKLHDLQRAKAEYQSKTADKLDVDVLERWTVKLFMNIVHIYRHEQLNNLPISGIRVSFGACFGSPLR